jgi:GTP-binding protein
MNFQKASFFRSFGLTSQLPDSTVPEIVLCGRSNVGKSSLINKLTGRKNLARTSSEPGKTATINFYDIGDAYLVDLPGYGYAQVGKKKRDTLEGMIKNYIDKREQLTNLFVLIDSRHEPQKIDTEFINWLGEIGVPFSIVFTKVDKLSKTACLRNVETYKKHLLQSWESLPPMFITSSENKTGREELLAYIEEILS